MMIRVLKHLPEDCWPADDRLLFQRAYLAGDLFDGGGGAGAHLASTTRTAFSFAWRRWLGFLSHAVPEALLRPAADRITRDLMRAYVEHLEREVAPTSVANCVAHLYGCACIVAPDHDWGWLRLLKSRLQARAKPKDRFERLVPAEHTLDLGFALMDGARGMPADPWRLRELQYRDGLILAMLSLWPIRRRSLAALTVDRHLRRSGEGAEISLFSEDTKSGRAESWPVPQPILPYLARYLEEIRPVLLGKKDHNAMWVGQWGTALNDGAIYAAVSRRTAARFGKPMGPHDFRRSAATFLAMRAPEGEGGPDPRHSVSRQSAHQPTPLQSVPVHNSEPPPWRNNLSDARPTPLEPIGAASHARRHLRPLFLR